MRWYSGASPLVSPVLAVLLGFALPLIVPAAVRAQGQGNSTVKVALCPEPGLAIMTLDRPEDGTTITNGTAVLQGTAAYLSEVRITVDEIHQTTVEMDDSADSYEQAISLAGGIHRIQVEGYDICGRFVGETAISVTVPVRTNPPASGRHPAAAVPDNSAGSPANAGPAAGSMPDSAVIFHEPVIYDGTVPAGSTAEVITERNEPDGHYRIDGGPDGQRRQSTLDAIITELDMEIIFRDSGTIARSLSAILGIFLALVPQAFVSMLGGLTGSGSTGKASNATKTSGRKQSVVKRRSRPGAAHGLYALRILGACLVLLVFIV